MFDVDVFLGTVLGEGSGGANMVYLKPDCAIGVDEGLSLTEISALDIVQKKMADLAAILTSATEKEDDLISIIKHAIEVDLPVKLLTCLGAVTFNTRQDLANVFCAILTKPVALIKNSQADNSSPENNLAMLISSYIQHHRSIIIELLLINYTKSGIALSTGAMFRECLKYEAKI